MAKKVFIEIPNSGSLEDLVKAIVDGFERLTPEEKEQFQNEVRASSKRTRGEPWRN